MMKVLIPGVIAWMIVNAVMLWCCCAINRKNSLSRCATAPSEREPDSEKGRIANGCDF